MKETLQRSQGVEVRVVEYEDDDIIELVNNGKAALVTTCVNADRRQKVALVDFRADLSVKIGEGDPEHNITGLGFNRKTETIQKDGQSVEVYAETEGQQIGRFVDALADGSFAPSDFTLIGQDDKAKTACAIAYLQKLASQLGPYTLDVNRPERAPSTGLVPKWCMNAATQIVNGEAKKTTVKDCVEMFTAGYTSPEGVAIDPVPFVPFDVKAHKNATPEEKEAVRTANIKNLAKAIHAADRQKQTKLQAQNEFA